LPRLQTRAFSAMSTDRTISRPRTLKRALYDNPT